jgi:hypothetical protein
VTTPVEEAIATTPVEDAATSATLAYGEFCTTLAEYIQSPDDPDEEADPADVERVVRAAPPEIAEFGAVLVKFELLAVTMEAWWTVNCPGFELD